MERSEINGCSLEQYKKKLQEQIHYQDELGNEVLYNMERLKISLEELTHGLDENNSFEYEEKVIVDELIEALESSKKEIPYS